MSAAARDDVHDRDLAVPSLFWSETTSAIHEAVWRREVTPVTAATLRRELTPLVDETVTSSALADEAWELADLLGWATTYDAELLALARRLGTRVLTTDARLRRGAGRTGLVLDPSELRRWDPGTPRDSPAPSRTGHGLPLTLGREIDGDDDCVAAAGELRPRPR